MPLLLQNTNSKLCAFAPLRFLQETLLLPQAPPKTTSPAVLKSR
jgi:hypothetical protein